MSFYSPTYYTQFVTSLVLGEVKNDDAGRIVAAGATRMTWTFLMNSSVSKQNKADSRDLKNTDN